MKAAVGGTGPCIALVEVASIAVGYEVTDALLKEADVEVLDNGPITPGKYFVLFVGTVEDVTSALRRALELAGETLIDQLFIPNVEPTLLALVLEEEHEPGPLDALGIVETFSIASTVRAADVACKTATLRLCSLQLAAGIGGKSYFTLTGEVADVESAVEAAAADADAAGMLVRRVVIPRPHRAMRDALGLSS